MLFAHLKRILKLGRLRLRGPHGAQFEFTLAAIAQNRRRLRQACCSATTSGYPVRCIVAWVSEPSVKIAAPNGAGTSQQLQEIASATSISYFCNKICR